MIHLRAGVVVLICGAEIMKIRAMYLCRYTNDMFYTKNDMFYTKNTNMSQLIMGGVPSC